MGSVGSVIHETEYKILRGTSELHIAVLDPTVRLRILPTKIHYSAQMILDEDLRNVSSSRDARSVRPLRQSVTAFVVLTGTISTHV